MNGSLAWPTAMTWPCRIYKSSSGGPYPVTIYVNAVDLEELFIHQGRVTLSDIAEMVSQQTGGKFPGLTVSVGDIVSIGGLTTEQQGFWLCIPNGWRVITEAHLMMWWESTPHERREWAV